jgi:hypothetical protein
MEISGWIRRRRSTLALPYRSRKIKTCTEVTLSLQEPKMVLKQNMYSDVLTNGVIN